MNSKPRYDFGNATTSEKNVILRSEATKNLSFIETVFFGSNGAFQKDPSLRYASFRMTFWKVLDTLLA